MWQIEFTDEFGQWWDKLTENEQDALAATVQVLEQLGPGLPRPYSDTVKGSKHANMKELRTQCQGRPLRTFYAFDPRRCAILLIGGDKTGNDRFYKQILPRADCLYDEHLKQLTEEGLI